MIIRKAGLNDIKNICTIHQYAFDKSHFSSSLPGDLLSSFYQNLLKNNDYNYVAMGNDSEILGFIVAGTNTKASINEFVKNHPGSLFIILLKKPKFLLEKLKFFIMKIVPGSGFRSAAELRLLSIAVKKDSGHRGVGTELIRYFEEELIKNNVFTYGLSVKRHNENAIRFYFKNNFEVEHEEKEALYFIKNLKIKEQS